MFFLRGVGGGGGVSILILFYSHQTNQWRTVHYPIVIVFYKQQLNAMDANEALKLTYIIMAKNHQVSSSLNHRIPRSKVHSIFKMSPFSKMAAIFPFDIFPFDTTCPLDINIIF